MKRSAGGRLRGDEPAKGSLAKPAAVLVAPAKLVGDVCRMIEAARRSAVATVNIELIMLYWRVGARIRTEVLRDARAAYGEQVIVALAQKLQRDYGRGFSEKTRSRMVQLAEVFPSERIVATLSRQFAWSHFALLLPIEAPLARAFYAEMCRTERWSVRALRKQIDGMLYERTALSRKPKAVVEAQLAELRESDVLTPEMVLKDPYILDFLGITGRCLEKDLEARGAGQEASRGRGACACADRRQRPRWPSRPMMRPPDSRTGIDAPCQSPCRIRRRCGG